MTLIACCSKILRSWTFADASPVSACSADFLAGLVAHCYYWHYCVIINNIYPKWRNSIFSSIFLKVQGFDNGDLGLTQQPLGLFPGLKTLTQHFMAKRFLSKLLNYYLSMRQHCTRRMRACPGRVWSLCDNVQSSRRTEAGLAPPAEATLAFTASSHQWPSLATLPRQGGGNWQTRQKHNCSTGVISYQ